MIQRAMSAWGDIQSFGGKRLQDGGLGPIGSNRGGARIRDSGRVASSRFMDSLGRPPLKLSCLSGPGLRVPRGPCQKSIFPRISPPHFSRKIPGDCVLKISRAHRDKKAVGKKLILLRKINFQAAIFNI